MAVRRQPLPFGKYCLLDRISIGGMAEVWRAKTWSDHGVEHLVAIKRILPNIAEDEGLVRMFIDEAKITVQLTHANIAHVFDSGKIGDGYFIAMEYVAGKDLRAIFDRCRKKGEPAPIPMTCHLLSKMCQGLDYAHRRRDAAGCDLHIVHRDVSPQNCLVSFEGDVKVIDFGIAKMVNNASTTQAGTLKGKLGYMSPEQAQGLPLDQRSDVFAAGVVLYEMLAGERLFVGDSDFAVLEKVRAADIVPPARHNRRIPEALEKIVLRALAQNPDERYAWAGDLAGDLQRFLIAHDSAFSRKDLALYMRSTFAEEVEQERARQADYAEIKAPLGSAASPLVLPASRPCGNMLPAAPGTESPGHALEHLPTQRIAHLGEMTLSGDELAEGSYAPRLSTLAEGQPPAPSAPLPFDLGEPLRLTPTSAERPPQKRVAGADQAAPPRNAKRPWLTVAAILSIGASTATAIVLLTRAPEDARVHLGGSETCAGMPCAARGVKADMPPIRELAALSRRQIRIRILTRPAGANVIVDGEPRGATPLTVDALDPGEPHGILFHKPCYEDATYTLMIGSGSQEISTDLEKRPSCP